jgi:hypothetical protein
MNVTLDPGTLNMNVITTQEVTEVEVVRVIDVVGKRAVAVLNIGRVTLWVGAPYNTKKAGGGWTDAEVEARVKEQIEAGKLRPAGHLN